ncbi:MAG: hypothetical protein IJU05_04755, partial [Schwartzia sp.]|nr:hypothetical protein [Schwartzia sp. (in: firmicutes)]
EMRTMCNLSEGIAEEAWAGGMAQGMEQGMERGMAQGEKNNMIKVIRNLWRAGKDMSIIKIASGWTEEQIMKVVQAEMN